MIVYADVRDVVRHAGDGLLASILQECFLAGRVVLQDG